MPLEILEFRTSLQKLLIALILILVPLTVFGFYVALQGDTHARQTNGETFRTLTRNAADATSDFIADSVRDVSLVANTPEAFQAVNAANTKYRGLSDETIRAKIDAIEQSWENFQSDSLPRSILTSDLARQLRRTRELKPTLLTITVADITGATVAATDRPVHYFQTDRTMWMALASHGLGAIHVSDLRYDDESHLYYLSMAYPILQEGTGKFVGAVIAMVDASPIFTQLNRTQMGRTGRMSLVREDGTVIESPGITRGMNMRSEEYAAIRDALGSPRGRDAGYLFATLADGKPYLIGFSDTGLKEAYHNLSWFVLATQEANDLIGPVRNLTGFAMVLMVVALLMLSLLAAYVFLHRRQELEDIEPHDEDKIHPIAA
jgi:Cache domain